jgi:hypothetical protein
MSNETAVPPHLNETGAAFYLNMAAAYAVTEPAAVLLLTRAAECVDRLTEAQAAIAEHGAVARYEGRPVANPATKLEKEARDGFLAAMRQLARVVDIGEPRRGPGRPPQGVGITWQQAEALRDRR